MLPRETNKVIHNGRGQTLIIESMTGANSHTKNRSFRAKVGIYYLLTRAE